MNPYREACLPVPFTQMHDHIMICVADRRASREKKKFVRIEAWENVCKAQGQHCLFSTQRQAAVLFQCAGPQCGQQQQRPTTVQHLRTFRPVEKDQEFAPRRANAVSSADLILHRKFEGEQEEKQRQMTSSKLEVRMRNVL